MSMDLRHGLHIRKSGTNYFIPSVSSSNSSALSVLTFKTANGLRYILASVNNFTGAILGYVRRGNSNRALRLLGTFPGLSFTFSASLLSISNIVARVENYFDAYERYFAEPLTIYVDFRENSASNFTTYTSFTLPANSSNVMNLGFRFSGSEHMGELIFRVQGFGRVWSTSITSYDPWNPQSTSMFCAVTMSV